MTDVKESPATTAGTAIAPRERPPGRRLTPVSVGVLCLWLAVFLAGTAGGLYKWATGYQRLVLKALNEKVRYVEIEPESGAPPVRVTSPQDIARLRDALIAASRRAESAGGRPPVAPADCAARIVYGDGTAEQFLIGRTGPPGQGPVEVRWGGYVRYVDGRAMEHLLGPQGPRSPATGPSTSPAIAFSADPAKHVLNTVRVP